MLFVIIWLMAQIVGAQYLVDYAKSNSVNGSKWWVVMQYLFLTLQFFVGGVAWDALKKLHRSEMAWEKVFETVKDILWYFVCIFAFFVTALKLSSLNPTVSVFFMILYLGCSWKLAQKYIAFMTQIKEGVGKL